MWINNKGKGWFITCKGKDYQTQKEIVAFLSVQFTKNNEPKANSVNVDIHKWFMSSFLKKDGTTAPKLVIQEYTVVQSQDNNQNDNSMFGGVVSDSGKSVDIESDDLPFY